MKVGEELLHALKAAGAKAAFGIPGDYVLPFFREMEKSGILPLYTLSHEPGVGFAADGAARLGGGVGVAVVTYGAGAMNIVNPVACAWAEYSPLVIISGAPGTEEGKHGLMPHHQIRSPETQMNVFREFTCDQARLDDPETAPELIERVIGNCLHHSRPVYIELPRNMTDAACRHIPHDFSAEGTVSLTSLKECLHDIDARLKNAKRPVILADAQVRRFGLEETVFKLAEGWKVPLLNSFMGKGLFAGKGTPYAGTYLGLAGNENIRALIEESDLAFILGVIPCDTNWGISGKRIDEKDAIFAMADGVSVCGKVYEGLTLKSLVPALHRIPFSSGKEVVVPENEKQAPQDKGEITPDDIAPALQDFLGRAGTKMPLVSDVGDCLFMTMEMEDIPVLAPGYYVTMGFSVPAAMGLQAATGERAIVLVGDGGFQMTGWELLNCKKYGFDPIVILLNNGSWEMLRQFQTDVRYVDIETTDYAEIVKIMGGNACKVKTKKDFSAALDEAYAQRGKPFLIEVALPAGVCTATMRRFAEAFKANVIKAAAA